MHILFWNYFFHMFCTDLYTLIKDLISLTLRLISSNGNVSRHNNIGNFVGFSKFAAELKAKLYIQYLITVMMMMVMISLAYLYTVKLTRTMIKSITITTNIFLPKVKILFVRGGGRDTENSCPHLLPHLCSLRLTSKRATASTAAAAITTTAVSTDSCCWRLAAWITHGFVLVVFLDSLCSECSYIKWTKSG